MDTMNAMPKKARLSLEELSILCEQIALILRAGLPLHDGMEALCDNYKTTRYEENFSALYQSVLASGSLYESMKTANIFPDYLIEMTGIGEKTGEMQGVMEQMAEYYEREAKIRKAIQNAVTYPLILIVMMVVLIAVLIVQVLPIFEQVLRSMGIGMDSSSGAWMNVGLGLGKGVLVVTGALIVLALAFIVVLKFNKNTSAKNFVFRMIAPLQRLNNKLYASRFAANMAMMLKSGYPLDESLELIRGIISDEGVNQKIDKCRECMQQGMSFPEAVEQIGLFEKLHCRMIRVGFQAGQTDVVMSKLAEIYEEEMDDAINRVVSIIEPSLVALMSVIIGAILLAVMLPLLSIMGGF